MRLTLRQPSWADLRSLVLALWDRRWIRFGVVGGVATVSYAVIGLLLVNIMGAPVLVGNAIAYILSFIVSYLGQCIITFRARQGHMAMLPKYVATQGMGFCLNSCIIWVLTHAGFAYEHAMPIAIVLVPAAVYVVCKYWVFPERSDPPGLRQPTAGEEG
jgi:putative flippase GtrA